MVKYPQKKRFFWAWIGISSLMCKIFRLAYCENYWTWSNQILHSDRDQQILFVGGWNMCITNPRWQIAAILKKRKIAIPQERLDQLVWSLAWDAPWPPNHVVSSNFKHLKIQECGQPQSCKPKNGHMSAMVWLVGVKFGTMMYTDPLNHISS